ncbi:MAG: M23 family metallopeptidase [Burkholderiaceae bacterium]|nr:M23 family metallopeptidase [Burkholderiaceae bacterium]
MGLRFALRAAAAALCLPLLCLSPLTVAQGPAPVATAQTAADLALLLERSLAVPVEGVSPADLRNTFSEGRPGHRHEAIDIAAPRGSKVFAVDGGKLVKLFTSVPGGLTVYQFDPQERFVYYYAHLDRYADGLREGMTLQRCDLLGYVGTSGNAAAGAPHLHFAVFRLGPDKQWWQGTALDPYPALTALSRTGAAGGVVPPMTVARIPATPCH